MKDHVELFLDTSGVSLHKRGYRREANLAPLHETMAAAMVNLARYRGRDFFWDPFCGSGTICIEAAMIALNRAPGLNRSFMAQKWACVPETVWQQARTEALDREYRASTAFSAPTLTRLLWRSRSRTRARRASAS